MKKFKLIIAMSIVLVVNSIFGQSSAGSGVKKIPIPTISPSPELNSNDADADTVKLPMSERPLTFYAAGKTTAHEGAGWDLGFNVQNIPTKVKMFQNIKFGLEITQLAQFGLGFWFAPLNKSFGEKVKFYNDLGLVYYDRNILFTPHDSLVSGSIGKPGKMIVALKLGCHLELFHRFGVFAAFNPGISFYPDSKFNWKSNGYWYWGAEGGFYTLFGGIKKPKNDKRKLRI